MSLWVPLLSVLVFTFHYYIPAAQKQFKLYCTLTLRNLSEITAVLYYTLGAKNKVVQNKVVL